MAYMKTSYAPGSVTTATSAPSSSGSVPGLENFLAAMIRARQAKQEPDPVVSAPREDGFEREMKGIALRRAQRQDVLDRQQEDYERQARDLTLREARMKQTPPRKVFVPGYGGHYEEALYDLPIGMRPGTTNVIPAEDIGSRLRREGQEDELLDEQKKSSALNREAALREMMAGDRARLIPTGR